MINFSTPICLVLRNQEDVAMFEPFLIDCGYTNVTSFTDPDEAYEIAVRKQMELFIVRMEMDKMKGIVFVQKIRMSGNYGLETHLFIGDKIDVSVVNVLEEHDINYVLTKPFTPLRIKQKLDFLIKTENSLTSELKAYRDAKAALYTSQNDMALSMGRSLIEKADGKPNYKVHLLMATAHLNKGTIDAAKDQLEKAFQLNPKSAAVAHRLADLEAKSGNSEVAADLYHKLLEVNPYNTKMLESAGLTSLHVGDYDKASALANKLSNLDQTNTEAMRLKAGVSAEKGDIEGAAAILRKQCKSDEELIKELNISGVRLSRRKNYKGALKLYQQCLDLKESKKFQYAILFNIGLAHLKLGDPRSARDYCEKALENNPNFEKAANMIKKINLSRRALKKAG